MGRFDSLPGIDEENTTRRNVLVGGGYGLVAILGIGAIAGAGEDDDSSDGGTTDGTDGQADTTDDDSADAESDSQTETSGDDTTDAQQDNQENGDQDDQTDDQQDGSSDGETGSDSSELVSIAEFAEQDYFSDSVLEFSDSGQVVTSEFFAE